MTPWPMCNQLPILGWIFNSPRVKNPSGLHKHRTDNSYRRNRRKVRNRIFENYLVVFMFFCCSCFDSLFGSGSLFCLVADFQSLKCSFALALFRGDPPWSFQTFEWFPLSGFPLSDSTTHMKNCNIFMLVAITDCSTSKTYLRWQFFLLVELVRTLGVIRIKIEILDGVTNNWFSILKI